MKDQTDTKEAISQAAKMLGRRSYPARLKPIRSHKGCSETR
jgi:hypothetical protein